jgi:hypothetical protein
LTDDTLVRPEDVASYLSDMIEELRRLAIEAGYSDLAYCLDVARCEAVQLTKGHVSGLEKDSSAIRILHS